MEDLSVTARALQTDALTSLAESEQLFSKATFLCVREDQFGFEIKKV